MADSCFLLGCWFWRNCISNAIRNIEEDGWSIFRACLSFFAFLFLLLRQVIGSSISKVDRLGERLGGGFGKVMVFDEIKHWSLERSEENVKPNVLTNWKRNWEYPKRSLFYMYPLKSAPTSFTTEPTMQAFTFPFPVRSIPMVQRWPGCSCRTRSTLLGTSTANWIKALEAMPYRPSLNIV